MGAERDANLHQPVGELEHSREAELPALNFPFLFPHGAVRWHLEVRYQAIITTEFHVAICCIRTLNQGQLVLIVPLCY